MNKDPRIQVLKDWYRKETGNDIEDLRNSADKLALRDFLREQKATLLNTLKGQSILSMKPHEEARFRQALGIPKAKEKYKEQPRNLGEMIPEEQSRVINFFTSPTGLDDGTYYNLQHIKKLIINGKSNKLKKEIRH